MKAFLYTIVALAALAAVCVVTCPDRDAHSDALKDMLNNVINSELSGKTGEDTGLFTVGSVLGTSIGGWVIDNMLTVENYFICSVGYVTYEGEKNLVSLGIMNHIFTAEDEEIMAKARGIF